MVDAFTPPRWISWRHTTEAFCGEEGSPILDGILPIPRILRGNLLLPVLNRTQGYGPLNQPLGDMAYIRL